MKVAWLAGLLAVAGCMGCRGGEGVATPKPMVSASVPDARPDVPVGGAADAPEPFVVTVELRPLTGQWRGWKITASGRVEYHDPFEGDDTLRLAPAEVSALVSGLRACGVCALSKMPKPELGAIKEWREVTLVEDHCSVSWPTDAWKKTACDRALRDGLAPLRKSCKGCEY